MSWGLFESRDAVWAPPPLARFPLERTKLARVGQAPSYHDQQKFLSRWMFIYKSGHLVNIMSIFSLPNCKDSLFIRPSIHENTCYALINELLKYKYSMSNVLSSI